MPVTPEPAGVGLAPRAKLTDMNLAPRTTAALAGLVLTVAALAACASPSKLSDSSPEPVADPTPTPTAGNVTETPLTELPEWARDGTVWIV